jgi:hypothetical protein
MTREGRLVMHGLMQEVLASLIADNLSTVYRPRLPLQIPTHLLARHVAATFVLVLDWWIESGAMSTAEDVDAQFRALVLPTLPPLSREAK